eukprot:CAMPEP_0171785312 /NCGR_PEP_ID=MMETSP0991-20121206/62627_1 /TAXON_ID=483369 /ORGANISM="non described non described, Strain CCMP2098" /LENGTH=60 /DNA_ID=CAMNT_0012393843 /DNA_START=535 /DNA_END=717 /DNA_ORIENTATION=-
MTTTAASFAVAMVMTAVSITATTNALMVSIVTSIVATGVVQRQHGGVSPAHDHPLVARVL